MDSTPHLSWAEAVTLFPYAEDDGLSGSPASLEDVAVQIESSGALLDVISSDVEAAEHRVTTTTDGTVQESLSDISSPTTTRVGNLLAVTLCASGSTRLFGTDGVAAYNELVDGLRAEYAERKAEILAGDCDVEEIDYPDDATASERAELDAKRDAEVQTAREEQLAELVQELQDRQEEYRADPLDAEAERAATRLEKGPTEEVMQELFAAGALPSSAVDVLPSYHLDETPLDEWPPDLKDASDEEKAEWLLEHPEIGANLAGNASDNVVRLMGEGLADQARELDDESSEEDIQALADALNAWNSEINAQFVKALGGDELVELVTTLGENRDGNRYNRDAALELAETLQDSAEKASWFLDEDEARQVAEEMFDPIGNSDGKSHAMALSYLLHNGRYGTEFLDTMGDLLDSHERSDDFDTGGWLGQSTNTGAWYFFGEAARESAYDPMASYMSALGSNGEAALDFFTDGDGREKYYLKERYWAHDEFESLLSALDSATTDSGNLEDPDTAKEAAELMSSTVEYLVNRSDNFGGWFGDGGETFEPGDVSDLGTESLAHMISTYMPAVDYYTSPDGLQGPGNYANDTGNITVPGLGRMNDMPVFEKSELGKLVQVAVSTESGFTEMREGVSAYQNLSLQEAAANDRDLQTVANSDGRLEGFFLKQVGDVEIDGAASEDAQAKAWIDLGKTLVGAVPMGGTVTSTLGNITLNLSAGEVTKALTDNVEGVLDDLRDGKVPSAFEDRRTAMAGTLFDADAITIEEIEEIAASTDPDTGEPWATPEEIEQWFGYGFPSQEEIDDNHDLENLISEVLKNEGIDLNEYWTTYKLEMINEFAE